MMVLPVRPETFRRSEVVPRQTSRLLKRIERAAFDFPKRAQEKGSVNEMGLRYAARFDGVTGSISFDENGDANKDMAYIKKAADGAFEFVKTQSVDG